MQNGSLKRRTKGDVLLASTNGHTRIHSESETSLNSSHPSLGSSSTGGGGGGGIGAGGLGSGIPSHYNTLPHHHHHHGGSSGNHLDSPNSSHLITRTLKHHSSSSQQETRVTQIIREIHSMGPDGQPMDSYSRPDSGLVGGIVGGLQGVGPGPEYVQGGGSGVYAHAGIVPRAHYQSPGGGGPSQGPPEMGYGDPGSLMNPDPYYGRTTLPSMSSGRLYRNYSSQSGGGDYEMYPESTYRNYPPPGGGSSGNLVHGGPPSGSHPHHQHIHQHSHLHHHQIPSNYSYSDRPHSPMSPSERSDSPATMTGLTGRLHSSSDYLRQGGGNGGSGYPPTVGYEEIDAGMIPHLNSNLSNTHLGNYDNTNKRQEQGLPIGNGSAWIGSGTTGGGNPGSGFPETSHYGNLPVRPYLLSGGPPPPAHLDNQSSLPHPSPGVPNHNSNSSSNDDQRIQSPPGHGHNMVKLGHGQGPPSDHDSFNHLPPLPPPPPPPHPSQISNHQHHHHPNSMILMGHSQDNSEESSPQPPQPGPSQSQLINNSGVRYRNPDLHEVIQFLTNPNPEIKANAAAYLQHLSYMDDPVKTKTRVLGGIPPLVALISHDQPEVHRNACGALRNLSYGRQNDENKKAIKSAGGIPALVRLLKRTADPEVKELVTGVLWNLSSCEELKKAIIDDGVLALVNVVIIPHSGWDRTNISGMGNSSGGTHPPDPCWSTVFKNASGVFRNVSSAGEYARKKLRECEGLIEALLHVLRCALSRADIDDKSVENCVCILRNLSYRCQEVEDPNYDKHPPPSSQGGGGGRGMAGAGGSGKGENLGCFGANKKKKEAAAAASLAGSGSHSHNSKDGSGNNSLNSTTARNSNQQQNSSNNKVGEPVRGMELLWQPEVVQVYLALLSNCSNPETLEAAAGAIQNLAACYWQPSIEIRAAVRKEKGLPVLVELLRMEVDRVVCAVATALRNLALDQRNKELIGKYAMRDLVQKLPSGRPLDQATSDDTIAAVLATLNEVIKKNAEFSRSLMEAEGVERLVYLTQQKRRYSPRIVKFASQVLYSMWQHQELREVYKKGGWTEQDFVSKGSSNSNNGGRSSSPGPGGSGGSGSGEPNSAGSPMNANSTLNRPMASQSGTRYEDKTMQRGQSSSTSNHHHHHHHSNIPKSPPPSYPQGEDVPLADMPYPDIPPGNYRMYPSPPIKPGEPLYAQVNREKKNRNRGFESNNSNLGRGMNNMGHGSSSGIYSNQHESPGGSGTGNWPQHPDPLSHQHPHHSIDNLSSSTSHIHPAGDSWV